MQWLFNNNSAKDIHKDILLAKPVTLRAWMDKHLDLKDLQHEPVQNEMSLK